MQEITKEAMKENNKDKYTYKGKKGKKLQKADGTDNSSEGSMIPLAPLLDKDVSEIQPAAT